MHANKLHTSSCTRQIKDTTTRVRRYLQVLSKIYQQVSFRNRYQRMAKGISSKQAIMIRMIHSDLNLRKVYAKRTT